MPDRFFCFRFDVDTHVCLTTGVPALLDLAQRKNIRFTFFFNMGRAVSRLNVLRRHSGFTPGTARASAPKLTNIRKLGLANYAYIAATNPLVGSRRPDIVRRAYEEGHDCGLHGGRNHAEWQHHAAEWSTPKIRDEVTWGLQQMRQCGVQVVPGFSSPGWQGSHRVHACLDDLSFRFVADEHGCHSDILTQVGTHGLRSIPTLFAGEPGGIGYLEYLRARGLDDQHALAHFSSHLPNIQHFAIAYDHPGYVGRQGLTLLSSMIDLVHEQGFTCTTTDSIVESICE